MAVTNLSTWPFILFGIVEPALLIWAYIVGMMSPIEYIADQVPNRPFGVSDFNPQSQAVTLQLINVMLLLAGMAYVCCWTKTASVTTTYLIIVAFADYGHIYATYAAMGNEFWNFETWNQMVIGNVGASVFLNINRWLTVLGAFGNSKDLSVNKKKR